MWPAVQCSHRFPAVLSRFLFSASGARYKDDLQFEGELECGQPAPAITASRLPLTYQVFSGPATHRPAQDRVEAAVSAANLSTAFSHVQVYAAWETDRIIGQELLRNVGLAMVAVFTVTLLLLANLPLCLILLLIVILTLVDVVGFLHIWSITIDIISCINIVLAIGLCVDYSVHIGHAYLVSPGGRRERALQAVDTIGPAVLNGGVTTLLALVLLAASTSHVFVTFFRVFVLTVLFGVFHGLVLLPVLLSVIGPLPSVSLSSITSSPASSSPASSTGSRVHIVSS